MRLARIFNITLNSWPERPVIWDSDYHKLNVYIHASMK